MCFLITIFFLVFPSLFAQSAKVVVVGAGIAGLTTAYRLQQEGIDVTVYEARNRVGGRILTANIEGRSVELGGQNIGDGEDATHLNDLIEEFDLKYISTHLSYEEFYFDGTKLISLKELLRDRKCDLKKIKKQISESSSTAKNLGDILSHIFSTNDPLYKIISVKVATDEGASVEKLSTDYAETLYQILKELCDSQERYLDSVTIKGGNALLAEKIASTLGSQLHLNTVLTKVGKTSDDAFLLTFENGEKVHADFLVLAIPCSVYERITFEKTIIPSERLQAMQNIRYGTNAKIIVPCYHTSLPHPLLINDQTISFLGANEMLIIYCTEEASHFSQKNIFENFDTIKPVIKAALADICPSSLVPILAEDQNFINYHSSIGYSWPSDPYVKGSYAYIAPGQEALLTDIEEKEGEKFKTLFLPIGNLYFVGEHTSILLEIPGTMEAACESGDRIAGAIKKAIENLD